MHVHAKKTSFKKEEKQKREKETTAIKQNSCTKLLKTAKGRESRIFYMTMWFSFFLLLRSFQSSRMFANLSFFKKLKKKTKRNVFAIKRKEKITFNVYTHPWPVNNSRKKNVNDDERIYYCNAKMPSSYVFYCSVATSTPKIFKLFFFTFDFFEFLFSRICQCQNKNFNCSTDSKFQKKTTKLERNDATKFSSSSSFIQFN